MIRRIVRVEQDEFVQQRALEDREFAMGQALLAHRPTLRVSTSLHDRRGRLFEATRWTDLFPQRVRRVIGHVPWEDSPCEV